MTETDFGSGLLDKVACVGTQAAQFLPYLGDKSHAPRLTLRLECAPKGNQPPWADCHLKFPFQLRNFDTGYTFRYGIYMSTDLFELRHPWYSKAFVFTADTAQRVPRRSIHSQLQPTVALFKLKQSYQRSRTHYKCYYYSCNSKK